MRMNVVFSSVGSALALLAASLRGEDESISEVMCKLLRTLVRPRTPAPAGASSGSLAEAMIASPRKSPSASS